MANGRTAFSCPDGALGYQFMVIKGIRLSERPEWTLSSLVSRQVGHGDSPPLCRKSWRGLIRGRGNRCHRPAARRRQAGARPAAGVGLAVGRGPHPGVSRRAAGSVPGRLPAGPAPPADGQPGAPLRDAIPVAAGTAVERGRGRLAAGAAPAGLRPPGRRARPTASSRPSSRSTRSARSPGARSRERAPLSQPCANMCQGCWLFRGVDEAGNWWEIPPSVDHHPSWVATPFHQDCGRARMLALPQIW